MNVLLLDSKTNTRAKFTDFIFTLLNLGMWAYVE